MPAHVHSGKPSPMTIAGAGEKLWCASGKRASATGFCDDFRRLENWTDATDRLSELAACGVMSEFDKTSLKQPTAFDAHGDTHKVSSPNSKIGDALQQFMTDAQTSSVLLQQSLLL